MKLISFLLAAIGAATLGAACGGAEATDVTTQPPNDADAAASDDASSADAAADDASDPFDTPTVCTSGTMWTRGDRGSASMHPGVACIACHTKENGPRFTIGGTVFPSAHEPDDCNGIAGAGTTVVITDSAGKVSNLSVNSAGNFYLQTTITPPFSAKVVANGKERAMVAMQTTGDCNSCHTVTGANAAPGRIVAP